MTTSVKFSLSSGAQPVFLPQSVGTMSPGTQSSVLDLYITHTGTAKIENCKFYLLPYTAGVYLGTRNAQDDYDLVIGWGNAATGYSGRGLWVNMNNDGGFPTESWQVFKTNQGDTLANAIELPAAAISIGSGSAGEIPSSGEAHIRLRMDIPSDETLTGTFYVDILMYYTTTS